LKNSPHPHPPHKPEGVILKKLSLFVMPKEPAVLLLSNQITSLV
jgi:hypothetical protein